MKTMYKSSLLLLAAILFAPVAMRAQSEEPSHDGFAPDGVQLHKTTTETGTNKYQIDLEAYVTGVTQKIVTEDHMAADIVLVLDVSGSMDWTVDTETTYKARTSQSYSYNGYGRNTYYYLYEGKYYPVSREAIPTKYNYYLSYTTGTWYSPTTHYLNGTSSTTTRPTNEDPDATIYTGVLYSRKWHSTGFLSGEWQYTPEASTSYSFNGYGNQSLYYKSGEDYYSVSSGNQSIENAYLLRFIDDSGVTHYLSGTGLVTTPPMNVTSNTETIYTGVLYQSNSGSSSKIDLLKDAVNKFIDVVAQDAAEYDVDHRISIVKFSGSKRTDRNGNNVIGNDRGYSQIVSNLTNNFAVLKSSVENLAADGATHADYGMQLAESVMSGITSDRKSSRVVVMFTDGQPTSGSSFESGVANAAISSSYTLKSKYTSTVYTVGIFDDDLNTNEKNRIDNYMNYVSSNYPNAKSMDNPGTKEADKYYQESNGSDLSDIFTTIAEESSTGGAAVTLNETSTMVVDVLGVDFRLQPGMDVSKVQLFLARPTSIVADMEKPTFNFETDETKWIAAKTVAPNIKVSVDEEKKEIVVGGYDFSANYVSQVLDKDGNPTGSFTGYKLIIRFPIEIDPNSPGGADVETNQITSGIYVDGEQIAAFNVPHAKIPNLVVIKKGLHKGESATFTISRADWNTGNKVADYPDIVLVATCNEEGEDAVAKVKIQVPGRYTVTESTWSWAYDLSSVQSTYTYDDKGEITDAEWNAKGYGEKAKGYWATIPTVKGTVADKTTRSITRNVNDFTEDVTDPANKGTLFIFTNVEKSENPAHAEAINNNEFYESRK